LIEALEQWIKVVGFFSIKADELEDPAFECCNLVLSGLGVGGLGDGVSIFTLIREVDLIAGC